MNDTGGVVIALFFTVVLLVNPVAGAVTVEEQPSSRVNGVQFTVAGDSSYGHRLAAVNGIRSSSLNNGQQRRLLGMLNETQSAYTDKNRTSAAVFGIDKRVAARAKGRAPTVTQNVIESDAVLAATATDDARRVFENLQQSGNEFPVERVITQIDKAERALAKGDKLAVKNNPSAVVHYGRSWRHAQRALDLMDAAVEPEVTFETRRDLPHNDTVVYHLQATVFDVRTSDLENATVIVNGNRTPSVDLSTSTVTYSPTTVNRKPEQTRSTPTPTRTDSGMATRRCSNR